MRPLLQPLMLSCKKAAELTDKSSVVKLSRLERLKLRMHNKACAVCNAYTKHSLLMDRAFEEIVNPSKQQKLELSGAVKKRIVDALN
ncbi:hypothetical protein GYB22_08935 [bacterium]|nr:hypothetical protein [bacterium]